LERPAVTTDPNTQAVVTQADREAVNTHARNKMRFGETIEEAFARHRLAHTAAPADAEMDALVELHDLVDSACSNHEQSLDFLATAGRPGLADALRYFPEAIREKAAEHKASIEAELMQLRTKLAAAEAALRPFAALAVTIDRRMKHGLGVGLDGILGPITVGGPALQPTCSITPEALLAAMAALGEQP
jgi:hypothetical protein